LSDLDIDRIGVGGCAGGVGVYIERFSEDTIVQDFCVGPNTRIAVNSEWDHQNDPNQSIPKGSRGFNTEVRSGLSEAWFAGVGFDQGTVGGSVHDVTFRNYEKAGIIFYHNCEIGDPDCSAEDPPGWSDEAATQSDNTFEVTEENCNVCDVTHSHWSYDPQCVG